MTHKLITPPAIAPTPDPRAAKPAASERETFYWLASLVLIIVILHFGRVVLVPFVLALLLTFVLVPAVTALERCKIKRLPAVLIIMTMGLATTLTMGWLVEQRVADIASRWPVLKENIRIKSRALNAWSGRLESYTREIREAFAGEVEKPNSALAEEPEHASRQTTPAGPVPVTIVPDSHTILAAISNYGEGLVTPLASALLVGAMLGFMLVRWELVRDRMLLLMGAAQSPVMGRTIKEATNRVSRMLIAQCAINGCFGLVAALGLWTIHSILGGNASLSSAIAAGLLCALLRFIPYIGIWIGAGIPLLLTFAIYPSNVVFFAVLTLFVLLEIVTAQILEPRWLGAQAGASPPGILISTVFWTWLWGPVGLLLSTPLTALLVVMGKHMPPLKKVYILLADRHELELSHHPTAA